MNASIIEPTGITKKLLLLVFEQVDLLPHPQPLSLEERGEQKE
jgi:hypothetical protein